MKVDLLYHYCQEVISLITTSVMNVVVCLGFPLYKHGVMQLPLSTLSPLALMHFQDDHPIATQRLLELQDTLIFCIITCSVQMELQMLILSHQLLNKGQGSNLRLSNYRLRIGFLALLDSAFVGW